MKPRKAWCKITYNGKDITEETGSMIGNISFTDPADGESDSLSIDMSDRDRRWITDWLPETGAILGATLCTENWNEDGETAERELGEFTLDTYSFSGMPLSVKLGGVSAPKETDFDTTEKTKTWENVTLEEIAGDIAESAGMELFYDCEEITIEAVEQDSKTDSAFLKGQCETYDVSMKIYQRRMVLFSKREYKKREAVRTFDGFGEFENISWNTSLPYTGAKMIYTNSDTEEEISVQIGTEERMLTVTGSADSEADARKKVKAALNKANDEATTMSISIMGSPDLYAGCNVEIINCGAMDGKYYINKASHTIGGGYKTSLDLSRYVEEIG